MARLHKAYLRDAFDPRILELTERFVVVKPWRNEDPLPMYDAWVHGACIVYGVPAPVVVKHPSQFQANRTRATYGEYHAPGTELGGERGLVVLRKWSLISLFHQFRHHLQHYSDHNYRSDEEEGQDAQEWACSLLYLVAPRRFRRMVRAGRIMGVEPDDLLKKQNRSAA